ncbi:MAG TPA: transcriptional repressor [Spirochaetia bacterium]|nr:transcriptional repressor [Spirochaetia bacterium]
MEKSKEELKAKKIKPSRYRLHILKYLHEKKNHPSADVIYRDIKSQYPYISLATIYNTLNIFSRQEIVQSIPGHDKKCHYDADLSEHYHFICTECQTIYDLAPQDFPFNFSEHEIQGHEIKKIAAFFTGICRTCRS